MTDIYDRSAWPPPEANPLVIMFLQRDEWYSNAEMVAAAGLHPGRALLSNQTSFVRSLRPEDAGVASRTMFRQGTQITRSNGGTQRVFNQRAFILAMMRVNTVNAAAFRDWLADQILEGLNHG